MRLLKRRDNVLHNMTLMNIFFAFLKRHCQADFKHRRRTMEEAASNPIAVGRVFRGLLHSLVVRGRVHSRLQVPGVGGVPEGPVDLAHVVGGGRGARNCRSREYVNSVRRIVNRCSLKLLT